MSFLLFRHQTHNQSSLQGNQQSSGVESQAGISQRSDKQQQRENCIFINKDLIVLFTTSRFLYQGLRNYMYFQTMITQL